MHELAVMQNVVDAVLDRVALHGDERITHVRLEVGRLAGVEVAALRFCFDVCTHATPIEGAALDVIEIAARARCSACDAEQDVDAYAIPCGVCGSFEAELLRGTELRLREVEVH